MSNNNNKQMQFLTRSGEILHEYPTNVPAYYGKLFKDMKDWLEARKNQLSNVTRVRVISSWMYAYLCERSELDELIIAFLPLCIDIEKQVVLQRPDSSGWDLPDEDWNVIIEYGMNGRVYSGDDF